MGFSVHCLGYGLGAGTTYRNHVDILGYTMSYIYIYTYVHILYRGKSKEGGVDHLGFSV